MIITTDKSHAEYYRDRSPAQSATAQSAKQESETAEAFDRPDILPAVTESSGSGLLSRFAAWLCKSAD